jgi:hypothetical protein
MSDDVTLGSLARTALAIWGGNPEAAAEYILVQVMNDRKLLRSIFLPTIQDAVGDQIIPQTTSAHDNVIEPADNDGEPVKRPTLAAFFDMVLPNGFRLGDVTREQVREAADHFRQNEVERSPRTGAKDRG